MKHTVKSLTLAIAGVLKKLKGGGITFPDEGINEVIGSVKGDTGLFLCSRNKAFTWYTREPLNMVRVCEA